jgi:hypothetical protein
LKGLTSQPQLTLIEDGSCKFHIILIASSRDGCFQNGTTLLQKEFCTLSLPLMNIQIYFLLFIPLWEEHGLLAAPLATETLGQLRLQHVKVNVVRSR